MKASEVCFEKQNLGDVDHFSSHWAKSLINATFPSPAMIALPRRFGWNLDPEFTIVHQVEIKVRKPDTSFLSGMNDRTAAIVDSENTASAS